MKSKRFTRRQLLPAICLITLPAILLSWNHYQAPQQKYEQQFKNDTVPVEKNKFPDKKINNPDNILDKLDAASSDLNMDRLQKQINEALKNINWGKQQLEITKDINTMDLEKIKNEIRKYVAMINWSKLERQLNEVRKINTEKFQDHLNEIQKKIENMSPGIQKELDRAKGKIDQAKTEVREYKDFINGLEKDELIDTKEDYRIIHKNGSLFINGTKVTDEEYNKYRAFLEKNKKFIIKKDDSGFSINVDNPLRVI